MAGFSETHAASAFTVAAYAAGNHGYGLAALTRIAGWSD